VIGYSDSEPFARRRVGATLGGKWKLADILGEGAAAWVYRAVGPDGEPAAVKILHHSLATTPVRSRFAREARIANTIKHPGVVPVIDDGITDGQVPYIVMEFLEGETLQERAERKGGALPFDEVMWTAAEVLSVLHAAHKVGVVHRDVKPENIYLTHDRRIRLLDFGVARLLEDSSSSGETAIGTVLGTLEFMPPEQAVGDIHNVGIKTDLWAVGATMFTLLTGRFVHDEPKLVDQLVAVVSRPAAPLAEIAPHVPEPIAAVVDLALRFDASDRWPTARAMQNAIIVAHSSLHAIEDEDPPSSLQSNITLPPRPPPVSLRRH